MKKEEDVKFQENEEDDENLSIFDKVFKDKKKSAKKRLVEVE